MSNMILYLCKFCQNWHTNVATDTKATAIHWSTASLSTQFFDVVRFNTIFKSVTKIFFVINWWLMVMASAVLHRLNFNLIEFYHHFFSLSLDIDFSNIQLFLWMYDIPWQSFKRIVIITIRLHAILLFYYNHHRIHFYYGMIKNRLGDAVGKNGWLNWKFLYFYTKQMDYIYDDFVF